METARAFWHLDDLIAEIVQRWEATGRPPSDIVDGMSPIRLRPEDQDHVLRVGIISLANDHRGTRGFRSGKVQSSATVLRAHPIEQELIEAMEDRVLARLRYEVADGSAKCVVDFTHEDAEYLYGLRVLSPRAQAAREEPFWLALRKATEDGKLLRQHGKTARKKLARLAIASGLTTEVEEEAA